MRARLRELAGREDVRILSGLVVAAVVLGAAATLALRTAGDWVDPGTAQAAQAPSTTDDQVNPGTARGAGTVRPAVAAPTVKPASVAKAAPAKAGKLAAPAKMSAQAAAAMSPLRPVPRQSVQPLAHLDEHLTYQYNALGRRDPFQPLMGGAFVGNDVGGDAPADVGGLKVVGIVWGSEDRFALCEDARGNSLVLREGDKVMDGYVEGLKRDKLIVNLTVDGQSQSVAIPLTRKGDNTNANR